MKHDYLLREAEQALDEKSYNKASKKYEEFADSYSVQGIPVRHELIRCFVHCGFHFF